MRLSVEGTRSYKTGFGQKNSKSGGIRKRFCLNCGKELTEDRSSYYLRGFCGQQCLDDYVSSARDY